MDSQVVTGWRVAYVVLFVVWAAAGVLVMTRTRGGWLTSYGDDVALPAWLYIVARNLHQGARRTWVGRTIGRTPETALAAIFVASALSEVSQYFWPHGIFSGRFDPWDLAAYAAGTGACYWAEKRSTTRVRPAPR
jgi:hypothetical protein